ncbi:uncharacterized protein MELLADRAFT_112898 [Melampsora larici-populina 98AG31]|uniref:Uncharacterized protein n=1 Tax=Melampsora larici-populina (strain 98AG31 / pathotype 3-4-7) TaxID=747676 RepID=F4S817_MELLP|nr:uncharacterized protein MELLADRAFT_112898 [Melampsora larici-populina 98AG31]EGF99208.1 hypothetical protein MELLADRAFT_112898 [Melampsora larici-populina 98AG31]
MPAPVQSQPIGKVQDADGIAAKVQESGGMAAKVQDSVDTDDDTSDGHDHSAENQQAPFLQSPAQIYDDIFESDQEPIFREAHLDAQASTSAEAAKATPIPHSKPPILDDDPRPSSVKTSASGPCVAKSSRSILNTLALGKQRKPPKKRRSKSHTLTPEERALDSSEDEADVTTTTATTLATTFANSLDFVLGMIFRLKSFQMGNPHSSIWTAKK